MTQSLHSLGTAPRTPIRALSVDLDDTLWPIMPAIDRADRAVLAWFREHCPRVAQRYDVAGMRQLRDEVTRNYPHLAYDLGALRRLCIRAALRNCGYHPGLGTAAWEIYYTQRLNVELYKDASELLSILPAHLPLAAVSNGNADLQRMGLGRHFAVSVHAHEVEARKPDAAIWQVLLQRLGCDAQHVLHIGDHPLEDVEGARQAGLQAVWLNRSRRDWPLESVPPLTIHSLDEIFPYLGLAREAPATQTGDGKSR